MPQETKKAPVRPSELLAAAAAIAAETQAYAEPIIFINPAEGEPGHFNWGFDGPQGWAWLDITKPSTDQNTYSGPTSVEAYSYQSDPFPGSPFYYGFLSTWYFGAAVVANGFTAAFDAGTVIDGSAGTFDSTIVYHIWVDYEIVNHGYVRATESTNFTTGINYMGVRFSDVDGYHYGWIGVLRTGNFPTRPTRDWTAFAWGYETEPGVPIVAGIPAPGTLAALAFGAVVTRRGRKRKDD
jgi:hypothetical protein